MRPETGNPKIIPEPRVLLLIKRHVGSGNEIDKWEIAIYPTWSECLEYENLSHILALADILFASYDLSTATLGHLLVNGPRAINVLCYSQVTFLV